MGVHWGLNYKTTLVLLFSLLQLGCASHENIKRGLDQLVGQNIEEAINLLGYPDDEQSIAGKVVYSWRNSRSSLSTTPTHQTSTGYIGGSQITLDTYGQETISKILKCKIRIITDTANQIVHWEYGGNRGACSKFSKQIDRAQTRTLNRQNSKSGIDSTTKKLRAESQVFCYDQADHTIYIQNESCTYGGDEINKSDYIKYKDAGAGNKVVRF